jgi:hypothetical protein
MSYEFTEIDDKVLDFMRDNFLKLAEQVLADNGKSTYYWGGLKLEITEGKPDYSNGVRVDDTRSGRTTEAEGR